MEHGYASRDEIQSLTPRNCATFYPLYGCNEHAGEPVMLIWLAMDPHGETHRDVAALLARDAALYSECLHLARGSDTPN